MDDHGAGPHAAAADEVEDKNICGTVVYLLFRRCFLFTEQGGTVPRAKGTALFEVPFEVLFEKYSEMQALREILILIGGNVMKQDNQSKERAGAENQEKKIAMEVSVVTVVINLLLSVLKLAAGILAHSGAMISDAVHSASDVFSTFVVMIGVALSGRKSDRDHPYGHERFECVVSIILAILLAATGLGIGYSGIETIMGDAGPIQIPGKLALAAAVVSIVIKEWMYWYTRAAAKKIKSGALMADAWHHRSDALSSVGAFIGIFGAMMGFPVLDPAASVIICVFIEKVAFDIFKDAVDKMIDKSGPEELTAQLREVISRQQGVEGIDDIKTRMFAAKLFVDVEIAADGNLTLTEAHRIAEHVHSVVEQDFPEVKHCMVHVNPVKEEEVQRIP